MSDLFAKQGPLTKSPRSPRIKLVVTDPIIKDALEKHSGHCVYAEALREAIPNAKFVAVDLQTIRYTDPIKGLRYTFLTPRRAQVGLVAFDQGDRDKITPHTVQLRGALITKSNPRSAQKKKKKLYKRVKLHQTKEGAKVGLVPTRVGGRPPPRMAMRREFGLRALAK